MRQLRIEISEYTWRKALDIELDNFSRNEIEDLRDWLDEARTQGVHGPAVVIRDINTYLRALDDPLASEVPRTLKSFSSLLFTYLQNIPGPRLYKSTDPGTGDAVYLAYYAQNVQYEPARNSTYGYTPASVTMTLNYVSKGETRQTAVDWSAGDVAGLTVAQVLAARSYFPEDDERRDAYLAERTLFIQTVEPKNIGRQYLAVGFGLDDLDGNPTIRSVGYARGGTKRFEMERETGPSKVVIDVFYEDAGHKPSNSHPDLTVWDRKRPKATTSGVDRDDNDDVDLVELAERMNSAGRDEVIPLHPLVAVFDLNRHLRLSVHITNLELYQFNKNIARYLILDRETKGMIDTLVNHSAVGFEDVIEGKGGGAVVLLSGRPGTGKTLTAEVFAEQSGRALYSVQASQLGLNATDVESRLQHSISRAVRWGAVFLIDEADVYIRERGHDLNQNAIVGVFLRVLEYINTVMFMTTNLPELVDDAIASRCIARIDYQHPAIDDQRRIWTVLAEINDQALPDGELAQILVNHPDLSGRDIKQLLKLAAIVAQDGGEVTAARVQFVHAFRPASGDLATLGKSDHTGTSSAAVLGRNGVGPDFDYYCVGSLSKVTPESVWTEGDKRLPTTTCPVPACRREMTVDVGTTGYGWVRPHRGA